MPWSVRLAAAENCRPAGVCDFIGAHLCNLHTSVAELLVRIFEHSAQFLCAAQQLSDCKFWVRAAIDKIARRIS